MTKLQKQDTVVVAQNLNWMDSFLEAQAAEQAAARNTLLAYRRDLVDFLKAQNRSIQEIASKDIELYLSSLIERHISPSTQARRLSCLRQFFRFLMSEGMIATDPTLLVESPKIRRPLPTVLSIEDVDKLLIAGAAQSDAAGLRLRAMLEIMYSSGMRVTELVSLPMTALPKHIEKLTTLQVLHIKGKGGRERLVPLGEPAVAALADYLSVRSEFIPAHQKTSLYLFPSSSKEGHLTRVRFFQLLKELALQTGLNPSLVTPHGIRHAFATHLLQGGADLMTIQKLLGHVDISTTQIYTHLSADRVIELVNQFHPLGQSPSKQPC